jgi:hypothetical protein
MDIFALQECIAAIEAILVFFDRWWVNSWCNKDALYKSAWLTLLLLSSSPVFAQFEVSHETDYGKISFGFEPLKSTYIGAYDFYVGPEIKKAFQGNPSTGAGGLVGGSASSASTQALQTRRQRPSAWKILFPNGKLPHDLLVSYGARPGYQISLAWERELPFWPVGGNARASVFYMHDANQFRVKGPSGLGILIDPTQVMTKTGFKGFGASLELPVLRFQSDAATHILRAGGGLIRYETRTVLSINSAFLRLNEIDHRQITRPMLISSYTY